jgi:predicted TIM-barrel fold metal-dependent hydrolase
MPNFYVDCSSSFPYLKPETALSVIRKYGADKVLFGTDYPMWDAESELKYFLNLPLEKNEINDILNMNAKRLFGLE